MSRQKGKRGEREFAKFLRALGVEARRGVQFQGGPDSPDVVSSLPVHWEVKRTEALSLYAAMAQAEAESPVDEMPVVAHRRNGRAWLAVLRAADLVRLLKEVAGDSLKESCSAESVDRQAGGGGLQAVRAGG